MNKIYLFIILKTLSFNLFSQGQWVWVSGDSSSNGLPVYGQKNIPNINNYPRAAYGGSEWTDTAGNLYVYGGTQNGLSSSYGDMWLYIPDDKTWTWVTGNGNVGIQAPVFGTKGLSSANNTPGTVTHNNGQTWVDKFNNLWLYNGNMWKFNPLVKEWTWMQGNGTLSPAYYGIKKKSSPANNPGKRNETSCTWVDKDDKFWMFGGQTKNDLWKYDYNDNEWTWINGDSISTTIPSYGNKGVVSASNNPGARFLNASWYDNVSHCLYLFGGQVNVINHGGRRADMWKYDIVADMWVWVSGSSVANDTGNYGTQCIADIANFPTSRLENKVNWTDDCGNFWMFGGGGPGYSLNDLWRYNPTSNKWTWVNGQKRDETEIIWGVKNVADPNNSPPPGEGMSYAGSKNGFFVYGSSPKYPSALWQYIPDPPKTNFSYSSTANCYEVVFLNSSNSGCNEIKEYLWDFGDGNFSNEESPTHQYLTSDSYIVSLIVQNCTWQKDTFEAVVNIIEDNLLDCESVFLSEVFIPNAFSPNNDGINDFFIPISKSKLAYELKIYNLTGQLIKVLHNGASWDGKSKGNNINSGIYPYVLLFDSGDIHQTIKGNITITF